MSFPLRILQVLTIMNRGGAETMVMNYYRHIDRSKVQFDFLVHRQERGAYDDEIEALGGKIFRIPPIFKLSAHQRAVRQFFREHPEYQIIHGHVGELGYVIYREAKRKGVPCIIAHAHNASSDFDGKRPIRWVLKHLIRKHITQPMTCGREAAIWLFGKKLGKQAIRLNNAIDASTYTYDKSTRNEVRKEMGWCNQLIIGDVARFSLPKNHKGLLTMFEEVLNRCSDSLLVLIGAQEGLYQQVVQQAKDLGIEHKVQFLGMRTDIPRLLQGMDVYCSPSHYEGLSVSMVEAQAAGLKVITSTNVPREVELIPGMVEFVSLKGHTVVWSDKILQEYERRNTYQDIVGVGFDIHENARWLENFYMGELENKH